MKKRILVAMLAVMTIGTAYAEDTTKLVTVVTSPDPQTQLMAMVLTLQAARQGAEPHVLLCGPAGDIALRKAPETATAGQPPQDMSPQGLMQALRQTTGATVEVCAIYLPGRGEDASVLLDGIGAADPAAMAARLVAPNTQILGF